MRPGSPNPHDTAAHCTDCAPLASTARAPFRLRKT